MITHLELANSLPQTRLDHADHELIALVRRWLTLQHELEELERPYADGPHEMVPGEPELSAKISHVERRLEQTQATTTDGARAKLLLASAIAGFWWTPTEDLNRETLHLADALGALSGWSKNASAAAELHRKVTVTRALSLH